MCVCAIHTSEVCRYSFSGPGQGEVHRLSVVRVIKPILLCLHLLVPLQLAFAIQPGVVVLGVNVCCFEILKC